jgi:transcriptional regulator with GAF, ATPase, and Fis domain
VRIAGRYDVLEEVGRGGQGAVLRVRDQDGALRALKIAASSATPAARALVLAEHEALARLRHPALPRVGEVGALDQPYGDLPVGSPFIAVEWIEGTPADRASLADEAVAAGVWAIAADVAGALAVIHAGGLLHRDVAPANVLLRLRGGGDDASEPDRALAVLVDLGLAESGAAARDVRGTPAYLAPEALAGRAEPRSDLYGLGATLWQLCAGRPPFAAPSLGEVVRAVLRDPVAAAPRVPPALADLIGRLMAREPDRRPASALAVLDELDAIAGAIEPPPAPRPRPALRPPRRPLPLVGRDGTVATIAAMLTTPGGAARVFGVPGGGAPEVVGEAIRRYLLGELAGGATPRPATAKPEPPYNGEVRTVFGARLVIAGDLDAVAARLGVEPRIAQVVAAARAAPAPVVLWLADDPAVAAASAALEPGATPIVLCAELTTTPPPLPELPDVEIGPIGTRELAVLVGELVGAPPPAAWLAALHARSGGLPAIAADLVAVAAADGDPYAVDPAGLSADSTVAAAQRWLSRQPAARRAIADGLAVWGGSAPADAAIATATAPAAELGVLAAAGVVTIDGDKVALPPALARALAEALPPARRKELAVRGAAWCEATGADALVHARLVAQLPPAPARAAVLLAAAKARLALDPAEAWTLAHAAIGEPSVRAEAAELAARAALAAGRYPEAIGDAETAAAAGAPARATGLSIARAAQRMGDLTRAAAELEALVVPDDDEVIGALARLLIGRGETDRARALAGAGGRDHAGSPRTEAAGLAAYYEGDVDTADAIFARLEAGAVAAGDKLVVGRALSLRGMVAQRRGDLVAACDRYGRAATAMREVGDLHAAAVAELNLGTALAERGRFAEALPALTTAARRLTALGARAESAAAEFNRGNSLFGLGQLDQAAAAATRAAVLAAEAPSMAAFARLLDGDVKRRRGDDDGARAAYATALDLAIERGGVEAELAAYIAIAEAGGADEAIWADAEALAAGADDLDRLTLARGRDAVRRGATGTEAVKLADEAAQVAYRAQAADRLDRAWRAHAVSAVLLTRGGDDGRSAAQDAMEIHDRLIAAAAPAWRAAMLADPERAMAAALFDDDRAAAAAADAAPARVERTDVAALRRLLGLSRRLNSEASVERLLDDVIDAAIELTAAERGFLLLYPSAEPGADPGALAPVVARNFAAADLADAGTSLSRSIAERAATTGEPVITVDAGVDERFGGATSVAALRLRSVLAVPLRQKGRVIGCLYVDHRLRGGAFDDDAAALLLELGDVAAVAIENARLAEALRKRTAEVEALNARLAADLADKDVELQRVKAALPADRDRLRHPYAGIVGRSAAVVGMLQVVDRAAESSLPAVIVGESGTGKELVARALHDHGPRRDKAFVAVNCSAVPEPLLESELFGHVRGSFTGADRDRRGLFEVADGGTLFLDEIADTGPAMQAKLLRVLQDGQLRRVGDHKTRQVDVRVIVASQRPLAELVTAGSFREDLRYRLDVLSITVPPLRARDGDLPLLIGHLLGKLAGDKPPPRLTRAAERAFAAHRWPGNIRELENALARAVALAGDVIDVHDLPEAVVAAADRTPAPRTTPDGDLRLKPAIEATERAYLAAALERARNNQTIAARLLGLSRFGLQKKLKRLAEEAADDGDD